MLESSITAVSNDDCRALNIISNKSPRLTAHYPGKDMLLFTYTDLSSPSHTIHMSCQPMLQDKKDHILAEGVTVKKGARALEDDVAADTVDLKKEVKEQRMRQIAGQLELEEFDEINDTHQGILTCQSYLREERPEVSEMMQPASLSIYSSATEIHIRSLPAPIPLSYQYLSLIRS